MLLVSVELEGIVKTRMNASKEHARLKVHLKMSVTRLRNLQQKKTALAKSSRREIATLLSSGKEASARIRVENIIREDISIELLEILELYCELLLARIALLESRECDAGLEEAVVSLIHAAQRVEVKELLTIRAIFAHKYGKAFEADALENKNGKVNAKVVAKLSIAPPDAALVSRYLREIARTYHVNWHSGDSSSDEEEDEPGSGGIRQQETAGVLEDVETRLPDTPAKNPALVNVALPSPTSENPRPRLKMPPAMKEDKPAIKPVNGSTQEPVKKSTEDVDDQSFDALMARFEKLKKS